MLVVVLGGVVLTGVFCSQRPFWDYWLTPDQQAQWSFDQGHYRAAAERFSAALYQGVAWYRAGELERAEQAFGRVDCASSNYNRGNALLLLGRYQDAIDAYTKALLQQPRLWPAENNRDVAKARLAAVKAPREDTGTNGKLKADEMVMDKDARTEHARQNQATQELGVLSDEDLRKLWLRRVQTHPADFLRARFARQLMNRGDSRNTTKRTPAPEQGRILR